MKRIKIGVVWSCSNYCHHEHKYKWMATVCGYAQFIWRKLQDFYYRIKPVRYVAIDVMSITGMKGGGQILSPAEILDHYIRTNILIYDGSKGHVPIPMKRRSRIKLIDSRSEKGQKLLKRLEKSNIR